MGPVLKSLLQRELTYKKVHEKVIFVSRREADCDRFGNEKHGSQYLLRF